MASINKTVSLYWAEKEYPVQINMRLIDKIEEDMNLIKFVGHVQAGDIRYSRVAILFGHLLRSAGCDVTSEQVFEGMFSGSIDQVELNNLIVDVLNVIFPDTGKKKDVEEAGKMKN